MLIILCNCTNMLDVPLLWEELAVILMNAHGVILTEATQIFVAGLKPVFVAGVKLMCVAATEVMNVRLDYCAPECHGEGEVCDC